MNDEDAVDSEGPRRVVLAFNAAINARDIAALDGLMIDDHALIDSAGRAIAGREEVRALLQGGKDPR